MSYAQPPVSSPGVPGLTSVSSRRWDELLGGVVTLLPSGTASVLVDGGDARAAVFAARLAAALASGGRCRVPLAGLDPAGLAMPAVPPAQAGSAMPAGPASAITLGYGAEQRAARSWDVVIWLRTAPSRQHGQQGHHGQRGEHGGHGHPARADGRERRDREERADIVIDMHDPDWPVIRRVAARLAAGGDWYLTETRAFFACRAATWDTKFGDDMPAYAAAISAAGIPRGGVVIDVGCGTGRALPPLRAAVGQAGAVIALDVTPEMLDAARPASEAARAALVLADARFLPFADASADAVFAAGLVNHLPDPAAGLRELARVTRPGGLLVLFHPSGRAALAARHGRAISPDEPLAIRPLRGSTAATGWRLTAYDDAPHRFFAIAERVPG